MAMADLRVSKSSIEYSIPRRFSSFSSTRDRVVKANFVMYSKFQALKCYFEQLPSLDYTVQSRPKAPTQKMFPAVKKETKMPHTKEIKD
jgi:hypothetical protein